MSDRGRHTGRLLAGEALRAVLDGAMPEQVLAEAQTKAATFATCMLGVERTARWDRETQQACARDADPDVRLMP